MTNKKIKLEPGVIFGDDVKSLFDSANTNNFAIPAVNVIGTNSVNAVLEADWFEDMEAIRNCTKQFYSDPPSFIRNLDPFIAAQFTVKPVIESPKIYQF